MLAERKKIYHKNPYSMPFLEKHRLLSKFVYDTTYKSAAKLCGVIRLFATDMNTTIYDPYQYNGIQLMELCLQGR